MKIGYQTWTRRPPRDRRRAERFKRAGRIAFLSAATLGLGLAATATAGSSPRGLQGTAHTQHGPHHLTGAANNASNIEKVQQVGSLSIPDVELVNQDGRAVRFYSDLIEGQTVVINGIFTTCTTICPPMGVNFARLQKILADQGREDVRLISLSVDPTVDTPERLKAWSAKFGARPGWTLLTGPKSDMDRLLKALKFFTPDKTDHSPTVLIGGPQGRWTRTYALAPPDKLAEVVFDILKEGSPQ